ncbi:rCG27488 [Rattus norvegicus]|uniref:RCG27488 n=1 Tax=Rattus norvegicus TaxID=10116 RepID=A6K7B8_RAT|nr:rCG27488 [Rattus norvegicus]
MHLWRASSVTPLRMSRQRTRTSKASSLVSRG